MPYYPVVVIRAGKKKSSSKSSFNALKSSYKLNKKTGYYEDVMKSPVSLKKKSHVHHALSKLR